MRSVQAPPKRMPELVSTEVSCKLRDRLQVVLQAEHTYRRLSFLESSLRIPPAHSNDSETTKTGRRTLLPIETPAGVAVPPAGRCRSKSRTHERGLRTCTDCSGNGFGDKLAHRVEIQTPQPKLHTGLQEAQRQPSANWARTQLAFIDTHSGKPNQLLHSATGLSTQRRSVTHQLPSAIDYRSNRCTLHWVSFGLGNKTNR